MTHTPVRVQPWIEDPIDWPCDVGEGVRDEVEVGGGDALEERD